MWTGLYSALVLFAALMLHTVIWYQRDLLTLESTLYDFALAVLFGVCTTLFLLSFKDPLIKRFP